MNNQNEKKEDNNQKQEQIVTKFVSGENEYQIKDWTAKDDVRLRQIRRFYDDTKTGKRKSTRFSFPVKFREEIASRLKDLLQAPELSAPEEGQPYTLAPIGEKIQFSESLACQVYKVRGHQNAFAHLRLLRINEEGKEFFTKKKFKLFESDVPAVVDGILVPEEQPVTSEAVAA